jgi:hypothetical protein
VYPRIDRHCPYSDRIAELLVGDHCRMCKRTVFDLSAMDEVTRRAFLAGCETDICVTYKLRPALAAAALAATVAAFPAAAQEAPAKADAAGAIQTIPAEESIVVVGMMARPPRTDPVVVTAIEARELKPCKRSKHRRPSKSAND